MFREVVIASRKLRRAAGKRLEMLFRTLQQAKRFLRIVVGFTVLLLGVILLVAPGPGWVVIFLGLGILAAEFVWARRLLDRMKREGGRLRDAVMLRNHARGA
jgi:uncharacterized protein (TIGR02611 family)